MAKDKYTAVWVSHSTISDFLNCPRAYFLKNVYRSLKTGHKINIISPPLALGQAVHEVIESLSVLAVDKRFADSLIEKFENVWKRVSGIKGGFPNKDVEQKYKSRGEEMLRRLKNNPGPLKNLAVKIKMKLPHFWLSEEDNIILCGKIDWLEYLKDTESVHIIDFKTSKRNEDPNSFQLSIYLLLVTNCQSRPVAKASYWYLERDDGLISQRLPDLEASREKVLKIAKQVKLARQLDRFKCPHGEKGCSFCRPFEAVVRGEGIFVGVDDMKQDIYVVERTFGESEDKSEIL